MGDQDQPQPLTAEQIVAQLTSRLTNPLHKRVVQAWTTDDPVHSMEAELSKILLEAIADED